MFVLFDNGGTEEACPLQQTLLDNVWTRRERAQNFKGGVKARTCLKVLASLISCFSVLGTGFDLLETESWQKGSEVKTTKYCASGKEGSRPRRNQEKGASSWGLAP
eukprot:2953407-Amphidinium_carterae.1